MKKKIPCFVHGEQDETFVCQHIPQGLSTGEKIGFFWAEGSEQLRPDAWCFSCEERRQANNGAWAENCNTFLSVKILCGACYDLAKAFNLRGESLDQVFH
jgi:hypothetical protein